MDSAKEEFIISVANDLLKSFDDDTTRQIVTIIEKNLNGYNMTAISTNLILYDTKSERIMKMFVGTKRLAGKSENTLKQYYREMGHLLAFTGSPIDQITENDIKFYLATAKAERHLKNATVENMRSFLSACFTWIHGARYIQYNPCANIEPIKVEKEIKKKFSDNDLIELRCACDTIRDLALIDFLAATGARVSEASAANIEDINLTTREVLLRETKGKKQRIVYLDDNAVESLTEYLAERGPKDKRPALWVGRGSNRLTPQGMRLILHAIGDKADVENVHPHRFRRTLATQLIEAGMPIEDVSKLLGHANVAITQRYYDHQDAKIKAAYGQYRANL